MSTNFMKSGQSTAASTSPDPAAIATPAPKPEEKRWFNLRGGDRAKQFTLKLKGNARWMKNFLHGSK